jgi:hypothetical protein
LRLALKQRMAALLVRRQQSKARQVGLRAEARRVAAFQQRAQQPVRKHQPLARSSPHFLP